jgi:hypothetical protein
MEKIYLIIIVTAIILRIFEKPIIYKLIDKSSKDIYYLKNFYSEDIKKNLKKLMYQASNKSYRFNNWVRKGSSISHHDMYDTPYEKIINIIRCPETLSLIKKRTGLNLQFIPRSDPNQLSILYYDQPSDGIDWHTDSNLYEGTRWACIYTIVNESNKKNKKFSSSKLKYKHNNKVYYINTEPNSLVLFKGDVLDHKVDKLNEGEARIVISFVLCDICSSKQNLVNFFYGKIINLSFYGKLF